jgi:hypothetical protein
MITEITRDENCNAIVTLKDGSTINIFANQLYDKNLHNWKGWKCHAGMDGVFIDNDFTVYSGQCKNDCLGNLLADDFNFLKSATICNRDACTSCTTDLYKTKEQNNDH